MYVKPQNTAGFSSTRVGDQVRDLQMEVTLSASLGEGGRHKNSNRLWNIKYPEYMYMLRERGEESISLELPPDPQELHALQPAGRPQVVWLHLQPTRITATHPHHAPSTHNIYLVFYSLI